MTKRKTSDIHYRPLDLTVTKEKSSWTQVLLKIFGLLEEVISELFLIAGKTIS